jgi:nucleoside-diphosphate-sugar epimerase
VGRSLSLLKSKKEVLLAGANGNIGSFIFEKLNKEYAITRVGYTQGILGDNYFSLDLTNELEVSTFSKSSPKHDALIFLVGLAHKKGKGQEFEEFRRINKQTLINLLMSLDKNNKLPEKIIFASTISVYGEKINQNMYNEDSAKEPFSPYAITKLETEEYLQNNYGTQSWILRFAPVYAPDFQLNINRRTKAAGTFYKVGNGREKLSLCNLENIGSAVQGILKDKVPAGVYNISDENEYSYNDLLKSVNAKWVVRIPAFLVKGLFVVGKMMNNIFLKENATKLISDNIFSSDKIRQYIFLPASLNE